MAMDSKKKRGQQRLQDDFMEVEGEIVNVRTARERAKSLAREFRDDPEAAEECLRRLQISAITQKKLSNDEVIELAALHMFFEVPLPPRNKGQSPKHGPKLH
jgi:hypothetical protein